MPPHNDRRTGADWLLGPLGPGRVPVVQTLIWCLLHLVSCALFVTAAGLGLVRPDAAGWWLGLALGQGVLFFALVRSGWSRRLAQDPALTSAQALVALATWALGYAVVQDGRGALLVLPVLLLMFAALGLPPRHAANLGLAALAFMAASVGAVALQAPAPRAWQPLAFQAAVALVTGVVATLLALRLSQLVQRLRQHKRDLQAALGRVEALTRRDELTGTSNRRHLHEVLAQAVERVHRHDLPFCAALVAPDQFGRIRDQHGHAVGDRVLRGVAELARKHVRTLDVVGRWGGDRFLLVMPSCSLREAEPVLERLRHYVVSTAVAGLPEGAVSVSASLVQYRPGEAVTLTLERADSGLQAGMALCRNRVHLASSPYPAGPGPQRWAEASADTWPAGSGAGAGADPDPDADADADAGFGSVGAATRQGPSPAATTAATAA
jgi:diguanylate cyclase